MPVIDEKTFAELKQMSGAEFINELIDTFLEDSPRLIEEMESALKVNTDQQQVGVTAQHRVRRDPLALRRSRG